jgi:hypothetical protein
LDHQLQEQSDQNTNTPGQHVERIPQSSRNHSLEQLEKHGIDKCQRRPGQDRPRQSRRSPARSDNENRQDQEQSQMDRFVRPTETRNRWHCSTGEQHEYADKESECDGLVVWGT